MLLPDDPILHVGDRLRIVCPEAPELCVERSITADGTLNLPLIGPVSAAVRRLSEIAHLITARLPGGIYPPQVEVRLIGPTRGTVTVNGAIEKPLQIFAPRGIATDRLWDAAKLLPEADIALLGGPRRLQAGTTITVPTITAERRIAVLGAVLDPKALAPTNDLTLGMALEAAGGLGPHGDPNAITVLRGGELIPIQMPLDAGFRLTPGDLVRVGLIENRKYVLVRGAVDRPGSVEYAPGMTATRAVSLAGGFTERTKRGTLVWQSGAKTFRLSIEFLLAGRIPDPAIKAEDTLTVEARP